MNEAYIFDVDGTLTPSRDVIQDEFRDFFVQFAQNNEVYLVSGSDYIKTVEQLGLEIVADLIKISYNCSGNSIWERGMEIYSSPWTIPDEARNYLMSVLDESDYPEKTGNHFEERPGAVNFSIVGRNADKKQRARYIDHDQQTDERTHIADYFNKHFGSKLNCHATVGGETGIDITETGRDKRQILIKPDGYPQEEFAGRSVRFFGDRCEPGGNDWPLAKAVWDWDYGMVYDVDDWRETMTILQSLTNS